MHTFRRLFRHDLDCLKAHYRRLDPLDRTLRFAGRVGDGFVDRHCDAINWSRAYVIGCFIERILRGVVELHVNRAHGLARAEIGVSVEAEWQGEGIGTQLMRYAIVGARNRLVRTVTMTCASDNGAMRHVAGEFTQNIGVKDREVNADIALPYPNVFSLWNEASCNYLALVARAIPLGSQA